MSCALRPDGPCIVPGTTYFCPNLVAAPTSVQISWPHRAAPLARRTGQVRPGESPNSAGRIRVARRTGPLHWRLGVRPIASSPAPWRHPRRCVRRRESSRCLFRFGVCTAFHHKNRSTTIHVHIAAVKLCVAFYRPHDPEAVFLVPGEGRRIIRSEICQNLFIALPTVLGDMSGRGSRSPKHAPVTLAGPARRSRPLARQSRDKIIDREIDGRVLTAAVHPHQNAFW